MGQRVTVDIAHTGPVRFAKLCRRVLTKFGYALASESSDYVPLEPTDFLVSESADELMLVRCEYRPRRHVGGPTIKKLDEEMWDRGAASGMLVTNTKAHRPLPFAAASERNARHIVPYAAALSLPVSSCSAPIDARASTGSNTTEPGGVGCASGP